MYQTGCNATSSAEPVPSTVQTFSCLSNNGQSGSPLMVSADQGDVTAVYGLGIAGDIQFGRTNAVNEGSSCCIAFQSFDWQQPEQPI